MKFYLTTHEAHWLSRAAVPLMVSRRRLCRAKTHRPALAPWVLDSGGFTELSMFGAWTTTPRQYVDEVRRWADEIGSLEWVAPQDHMCEPFILAKTGRTVDEHLLATVRSFVELRAQLGPLVIPVVQGYTLDDYRRCVELFHRHEVDLDRERVVGVGSVCRRQDTDEITRIFSALVHDVRAPLHGFGVKTKGFARYGWMLGSADSLAWSYNARRNPGIPGHTHKSCANCLDFALRWRDRFLNPPNPRLWSEVA